MPPILAFLGDYSPRSERNWDFAGHHLTGFAMMKEMRFPLSFTSSCLVALLVSVGCSTTLSGGQPDTVDAGFSGFPDAAPQQIVADAAPQVLPCVEGDTQVSDPDDQTCYMLFNSIRTWQAAQADCLAVGANLVIIDSDAEQRIVGGLSANFPPDGPDIWLGATDELVENSFVWVDGQPMVFQTWRDGEPNNNGPGDDPENCAVIEGDTAAHEWDDRSCIVAAPYICER